MSDPPKIAQKIADNVIITAVGRITLFFLGPALALLGHWIIDIHDTVRDHTHGLSELNAKVDDSHTETLKSIDDVKVEFDNKLNNLNANLHIYMDVKGSTRDAQLKAITDRLDAVTGWIVKLQDRFDDWVGHGPTTKH